MKRTRQSEGFTLLEALLAVLIFGLAVVALVEAINSMGRTTIQARQNRAVVSRLESLMTEFTRLPPQPASAGDQIIEKTVKEDGVEYHLRMEPANLKNKDSQDLSGLFLVKATARWKEGSKPDEISAETLVYPPLYAPKL
jgi:type II secretory pathway pseudopilin PulG